MKILDRYIKKQIIIATVLVVAVLMAVESFLEFAEQLKDVGKVNYSVMKAFGFALLQLPHDLYQMFPIAGFLGCLIGLGKLASSSELTVMRAAGTSVKRITLAVLKAALLLIVAMTLIGEVMAPRVQQIAIQLKKQALHKKILDDGGGQLWLHKDNSFINIGQVVSPKMVRQVLRFNFNNHNQLQSAIYAGKAIQANGEWYLINGRQTVFATDHVHSHSIGKEKLDLILKPELLLSSQNSRQDDSARALWEHIKYRQKVGLVANTLWLSFWQHILNPLTSMVMICLGVPFIFGSLRDASMGKRILTGVIIGFCFYMLNQLFGPFTLVYQFPPFWAAALPTLLFLVYLVYQLIRNGQYT